MWRVHLLIAALALAAGMLLALFPLMPVMERTLHYSWSSTEGDVEVPLNPYRPAGITVTISGDVPEGPLMETERSADPVLQEQTLEVDAVVCATGYRPLDPGALLRDSDTLERDAQGRPVTSREYRARWQQPATGQLYLLGQTRHQHGVSATLLSNAATRAQEISDAILAARAEETQASRSEPRGAA